MGIICISLRQSQVLYKPYLFTVSFVTIDRRGSRLHELGVPGSKSILPLHEQFVMSRGGFRGGRTRRAPPLFFAEIGLLTLCGHPRQKECTKSCKLTLKITIFLCFWGGTSPSDTPVPTGTEVLSVLNLGAPSFKKILDPPLMSIKQITSTPVLCLYELSKLRVSTMFYMFSYIWTEIRSSLLIVKRGYYSVVTSFFKKTWGKYWG